MGNYEDNKRLYTTEDFRFIRDHYEHLSDLELGEILGRSAAAIAIKRSELQLYRTEKLEKKASRRNTEPAYVRQYVENGITEDLINQVELKKLRNGTYAEPKYASDSAKKPCAHDKVYEQHLLLLSDPPMRRWICRKCGESGSEIVKTTEKRSQNDRIKEMLTGW